MYVFSQKQANNWFFGDSLGMTFNSVTPTALFGSKMRANEGNSTISDSQGNLLFYTNGVYVWNRNHQLMPNGLGLAGNDMSSQSALIVPHPDSANLYWLFTVDYAARSFGFRYSLVNMNLDGGLGDITTTKNILLLTPVAEKLCATRHANGHDIWVTVHQWNTNAFYSYLISGSGISSVPVISTVGAIHTGGANNVNAVGCMKFSADGSKLALGITYPDRRVGIFDFNNATGIVSNGIEDINFNAVLGGPYGVEFSPKGRYLYISEADNVNVGRVYQYDLQAANPIASRTIIGSDPNFGISQLQLAPDGKIYAIIFLGYSLHAITAPDSGGLACNFQKDVIIFNNCLQCKTTNGLPNFLSSYFSSDTAQCATFSTSITADKDTICSSDSAQLCAPAGLQSYLWNTGVNTRCITTGLAGNYYVTVTDANGCQAVSSPLAIAAYAQPAVSISVSGDTLTAYNAVTYQWYNNGVAIGGATSGVYIVQQPGSYTVGVTDANGCQSYSNPVVLTGVASLTGLQVAIIPNPSTGRFTVSSGGALIQSLQVFNLLGQQVYYTVPNATTTTVNLNGPGSGVYLIQAQTPAGVLKGRVLLQAAE